MARLAVKVSDVPELIRIWAEEENRVEGLDPTKVHANASTQCWWRCEQGHLTQRLAISKKKNQSCRECSDEKLARTYEESLAYCYPAVAAEWDCDENRLGPAQVTPGSGRVVGWRCGLGHRWKAEVGRRVSRGADCGVCANRVLLTGFNDLATKRPDLVAEWDEENILPSEVLFNSSLKVQWKCFEGHTWKTQIGFRTRVGKYPGSGCGQCSKRVSKGESEVASFIESLGYSLTRSSRSIIKPYELDMVNETRDFAVEFNGTYWHSEEQIQSTRGMGAYEYHAMKLQRCKEIGIQLLYVWQPDWEERNSEVRAALKRYLFTGALSDILSRLDPKDSLP